jgi:pimeloyl-ACP methyl ester carboxylesterase
MPHLVASDEVEIYHEDFGSGPSLLFIHAGNLSHAMWEGSWRRSTGSTMRCATSCGHCPSRL